jgi:hypothetical protein
VVVQLGGRETFESGQDRSENLFARLQSWNRASKRSPAVLPCQGSAREGLPRQMVDGETKKEPHLKDNLGRHWWGHGWNVLFEDQMLILSYISISLLYLSLKRVVFSFIPLGTSTAVLF